MALYAGNAAVTSGGASVTGGFGGPVDNVNSNYSVPGSYTDSAVHKIFPGYQVEDDLDQYLDGLGDLFKDPPDPPARAPALRPRREAISQEEHLQASSIAEHDALGIDALGIVPKKKETKKPPETVTPAPQQAAQQQKMADSSTARLPNTTTNRPGNLGQQVLCCTVIRSEFGLVCQILFLAR